MKEENKRKNMEEELSHADESLKAANLLIDSQLFREAIPKLYYALFYILRALLFTKGLERKSHEGVSHYFNIHFVRKIIACMPFIIFLDSQWIANWNQVFEVDFSK